MAGTAGAATLWSESRREEYRQLRIDQLRACAAAPTPDRAHYRADDVLLDCLRDVGLRQVADEYVRLVAAGSLP